MSFTYCKSCGHKNLYEINVPKFCGGCGASLSREPGPSSASVPKSETVKRKKRTRPTSNEGESAEGSDITSVPQINSLQYEVSNLDSYAKVIKIEEIIESEGGLREEKGKKSTNKRGRRKRKSS